MQVRFFSRFVCASKSSVNQTERIWLCYESKKIRPPGAPAILTRSLQLTMSDRPVCPTWRPRVRRAAVRASPSHTAKRAPPRATRSLASPPSAQRRGQDPLLPAPTKSYPPRRAPAPAPARESQSARWRRSPTAEAGRACSAATQGIGMRGSPSLARDVAGVETKGSGGSLAGPCHQCHAEVAKPLPLIFELEVWGLDYY